MGGYEDAIERADAWFIGEDRFLDFRIFAQGVTDDQIADDSGTRENIAGWLFEWILRAGPDEATALITKTSADGIAITDAAQGEVRVTITDDDTVNLAPGSYFHSLKRTNAGAETVLSFGPAILRRAATR